MGWIVLLGLIAWPILEIYVFVQVGEAIGWINTIAVFLGAGVVGLWLLRAEGVSLLLRARNQMQNGVAPVGEALDALCLVAGGVLLLLPGFLSDVMALLLFLPPTRFALKRLIARHAIVQASYGAESMARTVVIEGEFEDVTPETPETPKVDDRSQTPPGDIVRKRE
jgi:UPF0716 protein FxsA